MTTTMTPGTVREDGRVLDEYGVVLPCSTSYSNGFQAFVERWFEYCLVREGVEPVWAVFGSEPGVWAHTYPLSWVYSLGWRKPRPHETIALPLF